MVRFDYVAGLELGPGQVAVDGQIFEIPAASLASSHGGLVYVVVDVQAGRAEVAFDHLADIASLWSRGDWGSLLPVFVGAVDTERGELVLVDGIQLVPRPGQDSATRPEAGKPAPAARPVCTIQWEAAYERQRSSQRSVVELLRSTRGQSRGPLSH